MSAPAAGPTTLAAAAAPDAAAHPPVAVPGYEVLGDLGRGGMGVVYRAPAMNRHFAVKVPQQRSRESQLAVRRFVEVGQVTDQLQHPGVSAVHPIGTRSDGSP